MDKKSLFDWGKIGRFGFLGGVIALSLSLIGVVGTFAERDVIGSVVTVGHVFLFGAIAGSAYLVAQQSRDSGKGKTLLGGALVGFLAGLPIAVLILVALPLDLRRFMHNVSPDLLQMLTFGQSEMAGLLIMMGISVLLGLVSAGLTILPSRIRRPILAGLAAVFLIGLLSETIILAWGNQGLGLVIRGFVFAARGLSILGAVLVFALTAGLTAWWASGGQRLRERVGALPPRKRQAVRWSSIGLGILAMLFLPMILRTYLTEVIDNVGLYILMGLGLNIVVGFAGLLDLGYVAFFAIGAYTMGVLTSQGELGIGGFTFWSALPIAVGAAVTAGIILGVPVLRMRGDYLAIVTLGFGEIIRILALSNFLAPFIGGAQGILQIPKINVLGMDLVKPEQLYYMLLAGCLLAFFVSWRLGNARLGRQWMAVREDEDVAEAMGINLTKTKLLAFAFGAAFSGLSGAIFATKLSSVFPHSFNLMVSINVLCLIIVGGMGSLPGVVVGALVLVGLPELLREFADYRMLMYGALLIVMMIARPEGFWPSAVRQRELRAAAEASSPGGGGSVVEPI